MKDNVPFGDIKDMLLETEIEMYKRIMNIKDDLTITYDPSKNGIYHLQYPSINTQGTYVNTLLNNYTTNSDEK